MVTARESLRRPARRSATARPQSSGRATRGLMPLTLRLIALIVLTVSPLGQRSAAAFGTTRGPRPRHALTPQFTPTLSSHNAARDRTAARNARVVRPSVGRNVLASTAHRSRPFERAASSRAPLLTLHRAASASTPGMAPTVDARGAPHTSRGRQNRASSRAPRALPPPARRPAPRATSGGSRRDLRRITGPAPAARVLPAARVSRTLANLAPSHLTPDRLDAAARRVPAASSRAQTESLSEAALRPPVSEPPHSPAKPTTLLTPPGRGEVFATGESHPDDDERLTLHPAAAIAEAEDRPIAPIERAASTTRVDGFGAEGVLLPSAVTHPSPRRPPAAAQISAGSGAVGNTGLPLQAIAPPSPAELSAAAVQPLVLPAHYGSDGRLLVPAPLRGTRDILYHQNQMADQAGLERIRDDGDLHRLYAARQLVDFPVFAALRVNPELPASRRLARPWTVHFTADAARSFYARFGQPLQVNSAVRTMAYQRRLQRVNGNAAAVDGDGASPHLTGQAVDLGKRGMSLAEIAWMRSYLIPLIAAGQVDVEEEFQQACFHISVYRSYDARPANPPKLELAQVKRTPDQPRTVLPGVVSPGVVSSGVRSALDAGAAADLPH